MGQQPKLISVIVLSYNAEHTISRVVSSVLAQDYPRVELIVTDDGTPGFSADHVIEIIENGKHDNLENYQVLANEVNEGTVANLWHALDVFTGDCFMIIGADDVLASPRVLSNFAEIFEAHLWKPLVVTGKAEMWSEDLNEYLRDIPSPHARYAIRTGDAKILYETLCGECAVPIVATCFQRDFIQKVDAFDRKYKYYEDYPTFLRMARKGICPCFANLTVTKHAAGGIANSSKLPNLNLAIELHLDRRLMWKTEYLPYRSELSPEAIESNKERRKLEFKLYRNALNAHGLETSDLNLDKMWNRKIGAQENSKATVKVEEKVKKQIPAPKKQKVDLLTKSAISIHVAAILLFAAIVLAVVFGEFATGSFILLAIAAAFAALFVGFLLLGVFRMRSPH